LTPAIKPFPNTVINFEGLDEDVGVMEVISPRKETAADPLMTGWETSEHFNVTTAEPPKIWPDDK